MITTTALLVAGLAATVIGAGVGAYGQYQAGQTQSAIAQFNATQQELNARTTANAMAAQAAITRSTAETNFKLNVAEAQAKNANAHNIELQALGQDAINRTNLEKRREEFGRMQASQRAEIAASGVAEASGTPMLIIEETAAKIQQDQEEQHYAGEIQRRTLFSEAAQERLGGKFALAGATLDRNSALAEADLRAAAGTAEYLSGMRTAEITRLTGGAAASAGTFQAGATLFSGLGSAAHDAAPLFKKKEPATTYGIS